jgi:FkbM family methyltransferase
MTINKNRLIETPTSFEDIKDCQRFFILGEGEQANMLHALIAGRFSTKFFGYLSTRNTEIKIDRKTSYSIRPAECFLPDLGKGDYVFLIERSSRLEKMLTDKGVRIGYGFFFVNTIVTYETPTFNHFLHQYFCKFKPKLLALDIGANFGITSTMMSTYFEKIIAFEPNKSIYDSLLKNDMLAKNIELSVTAFGDQQGSLDFFESSDHGNGSLKEVLFSDGDSYKVEVSTVDAYCNENSIKPNFIKIDAEGVDLKIIQGAKSTIETLKPMLYFENPVVSPLTHDEDEWQDTLAFLRQHYELKAYPGLHQPFPHSLLGTDYFDFIKNCPLKSPLNIAAIPK